MTSKSVKELIPPPAFIKDVKEDYYCECKNCGNKAMSLKEHEKHYREKHWKNGASSYE